MEEFFCVLQSRPLSHWKKEVGEKMLPLESSIDEAPYVHISKEGMVAGVSDEVAEIGVEHQGNRDEKKAGEGVHVEKQSTKEKSV